MTKRETYELSPEALAAIGQVEAARMRAAQEGVAISYNVQPTEEPKPRNSI